MNAQEITAALGGRWFNRQGKAKCPAHADKSPSLSIRDGDRGVLLHCFAGCEFRDIASELQRRGLLDRQPARKRPPAIVPRCHPLSDKALKLGRYSERETSLARNQRIERACRVDLILDGYSAEEIKRFSYGK